MHAARVDGEAARLCAAGLARGTPAFHHVAKKVNLHHREVHMGCEDISIGQAIDSSDAPVGLVEPHHLALGIDRKNHPPRA
jgi:hypothetical protein